MKIQKIGKFITYIMAMLSLIMIVNGVAESFKYSAFYNKATAGIIREYKNAHKMLWSTKLIENNYIKSTFVLLSGNTVVSNIKNISDTTINIKLNTKTGKAKVLLWDDKEEVVISEILSQDEEEISIKSGEYQVIVVGQWFTGEVILDTKDARISDVN